MSIWREHYEVLLTERTGAARPTGHIASFYDNKA
jgi:hypothetical protein